MKTVISFKQSMRLGGSAKTVRRSPQPVLSNLCDWEVFIVAKFFKDNKGLSANAPKTQCFLASSLTH